jgi:hypothetical protein
MRRFDFDTEAVMRLPMLVWRKAKGLPPFQG